MFGRTGSDRKKKAGIKLWVLPAAGVFLLAAVFFLLHRDPFPPDEPDFSGTPAVLPEALRAGDMIAFGRYEQDNDRDNGVEAIEWQVLAVEEGRALVISKYALDAKPFNEEWRRVTWENCSLRGWLNRDFYNAAFSSAERARILAVNNKNPDNPTTGMPGGNDTTDRVFLLSTDELESCFDSDEARKIRGTAYAKANAAYINEYNGSSWWWLRTRGSVSRSASLVLFSGYVNTVGYGVNNAGGYVRPAIWLDLQSAAG